MSATGVANRGAAELLPTRWWVRGIALHERAATGAAAGAGPDGEAHLQRWRDQHGGALPRRLAELGLTEAQLAAILTESPEQVCARLPRPSWVDTIEQAVAAAGEAGEQLPLPAPWREAFALVVEPFARLALDAVTPAVGALEGSVRADFRAALAGRLVGLATPALVHELHRRRDAGLLTGPDGAARFASFIRSMATRQGLIDLVLRYPVLARLLAVTASSYAQAWIELLTRFAADRAAIVAGLLDGIDPGGLVSVRTGLGDAHHGGRATALLRFADQRAIVYKPRDVECQVRLDAAVAWLNRKVPGLGLRRLRTVVRPEYGWSEYVAHEPLADAAAAERFYRRQGALLALLHVLHAVDIHCENLVAAGDQPVVVDAETLLHHPSLAELRGSGDPAADLLATSVHRTALLPLMAVGEEGILDVSGTGGDCGAAAPTGVTGWLDAGTDQMRPGRARITYPGAANRPRLPGDVEVDPLDYEPALVEGFRAAYDAMACDRATVSALVESCAQTVTRLIVRPTWTYRALINESLRLDCLADALERDLTLGVLWAASADPYLSQFPAGEAVALWRAEVPLFHTRPADQRVWSGEVEVAAIPAGVAGGTPLARPTGLAAALGKVADLGETDRQDQEWIISATLATRRQDTEHRATTAVGAGRDTATVSDRLITAAGELGDRIVARGIPGPARVNWLGLELVDERQWLVLPMGAGLAHGYLGVALFLAQLAEVTGVQRYADVARRAVRAVPRLFDQLSARPEAAAAIGNGGLYGFGGIAYALARLAGLLADPDIEGWTRTAVDLAGLATGAGDRASVGWAEGSAGCLAAMVSVHRLTHLDTAAALAHRCADHLVAHLHGGAAPGGVGFSAGWAGICWSLTSYAGWLSAARAPHPREPGDRYRQAAGAAFQRTLDGQPAPDRGWCQGEAGLLLALAQRGHERTGDVARRLTATPLPQDLSLCHGALGTVEALLFTSTLDPAYDVHRHCRPGALADMVLRRERVCGTPGAAETPGFLAGLAGIGYGLLRLAQPTRVPSALLLQHSTDI